MNRETIELEDLKRGGLTTYQARAYICLLRYGPQEGSEVAQHTEIPKTRVYDVLKSLIDEGLASKIQDNPMKFSPIDPESGLKSLFEEKVNKLKFHQQKALEELHGLQEKKQEKEKVEEKVDVISGFDKMFSYVNERFKETRDELLIFSVGEEIPNSLKVTMKRLVDRGVDLKFIASKYDEENIDILREFKNRLGMQIRHVDTTQEYTFSVRDGQGVMINVRDPEDREDRISVFFSIPSLAQALRDYFYSLWGEGERVDV